MPTPHPNTSDFKAFHISQVPTLPPAKLSHQIFPLTHCSLSQKMAHCLSNSQQTEESSLILPLPHSQAQALSVPVISKSVAVKPPLSPATSTPVPAAVPWAHHLLPPGRLHSLPLDLSHQGCLFLVSPLQVARGVMFK